MVSYRVEPFLEEEISTKDFLQTPLRQPIPIGDFDLVNSSFDTNLDSCDLGLAVDIRIWLSGQVGGGEQGLHYRDDALFSIYHRLANLNPFSRDTSESNTTGTTRSDRTDFLDGVPIVVIEEKDLILNEAVNDIINKAQWLPNYHTIPFYFGIAVTRTALQILKVFRSGSHEVVFEANLGDRLDLWKCVIAAINISRTLLLFRNNKMVVGSTLTIGVWHDRGRKKLRLLPTGHEIRLNDPDIFHHMIQFYNATKDIRFIEHMIKSDANKNRICLTPLGIMRFPATPDEVRIALTHICTAVFALHDLNYLHCDLRWSNIVEAYGSWTLIDCEYACHMDDSDRDLRLERSRVIKRNFVLHQSQEWDKSFDLYQIGLLLNEGRVDMLLNEDLQDLKILRNLILSKTFEYSGVRGELCALLGLNN